MKILTWNVNGLRSLLNKGIPKEILEFDIIMFQEIKTDSIPEELNGLGYEIYINPAKRKGYSGTLTMSKLKPINVTFGIGNEDFDSEGRVISLEFKDYYVINAYFPNAQHGLTRLDYKLSFNSLFEKYLSKLKKPKIICGDFNVAHKEIDIARPKDNINNPGFTQQERDWMTHFLDLGYVDAFRIFHKEPNRYSWWTYRFHAREKNIGWRIDYCVVSSDIVERVKDCDIMDKIMGSDHAPVYIIVE
ncbi:exodeoxyribonuclease III [Caldisphaera sp.]|uniref:exodeoxyribonuclease III n=1 Tax=Caldisphaera sp. TaxID=2060322 RepID=UPI0025BF689F|nr:exodeoxyribonuclease III [Caldisphaera sp.]